MAAGYGAMLERHGFQRVSKVQYRLDRPGITWRAAIGKGLSDRPEDSFRESVGCQIEGLPELMEKLGEIYKRRKLPGTRIPVDWWTDTISAMSHVEEAEFLAERDREDISVWTAFKRVLRPLQRKESLYKRHPALDSVFRGDGHMWILPDDQTLEDLTAEITELWEEYLWQELEPRLMLDGITSQNISISIESRISAFVICTNYLCGKHREVHQHLDYHINRGRITKSEMEQKLLSSGYFEEKKIGEKRMEYKESIEFNYRIRNKNWESARKFKSILYG